MAVPIPASTKADLERIRQSRVFFSHHSVGGNLLEGMARLSTTVGATFKPTPLDEVSTAEGPVWADARGGKNGDPRSKIDFFAESIRTRTALKPKLALMKFCYVDFNPSTNVEDLFGYYQRTLSALKSEHPEITFGHVTLPLMARPTDLKSRIQRLLGRQVWEDAANVKRDQFNHLLARTFSGDPLFDLSRAESTRPDGTRETFTSAGGEVPSLHPGYTDDGGHLNDLGRQVIGAQMIHFVASTLEARR